MRVSGPYINPTLGSGISVIAAANDSQRHSPSRGEFINFKAEILANLDRVDGSDYNTFHAITLPPYTPRKVWKSSRMKLRMNQGKIER